MLLPRKEMLSILSGVILDAEGYNKEAKIQVKMFSSKLCILCILVGMPYCYLLTGPEQKFVLFPRSFERNAFLGESY